MKFSGEVRQTQLGTLPSDWEVRTLAELCTLICDGTHFTPKYVPTGIPFYSVESVTANDFVNTKFITQEEHAQLIKRCKPERGDILMTRITAGILGDTKLIDWDVNASIYVSLALLKLRRNLNPKYIYMYSKSPAFRREIEKRGLVNATPKKINMNEIGAVPVPMPRSIEEQESIANALGDVDALVSSIEKLLLKKRLIKKGAMQDLLTGRRRIKGFSENWRSTFIENICEISTGSKNTQDKVENGFYPFFVRSQQIERINSYSFDGEAVLTAGDGVGTGKVFHYINGKFDVHQRVYKMSNFNSDVSGYFFFLYFSTFFYDRIMQMTAKSSVDSVRREMISRMEINFPSKPEQLAIENTLKDMASEIAALEGRLDKLRLIKQGMMQELLTGRIRLI